MAPPRWSRARGWSSRVASSSCAGSCDRREGRVPLLKEDAERLQTLLHRLAELNDELLLSAQTRLLNIGTGTSTSGDADGGNELWLTHAALQREHQQQRRAIQSAQWALRRLARKAGLTPGARSLGRETWGDPARELQAALTRDDWHKGEPRDRSLAEADRAACAALRCAHCQRHALRYTPYVRLTRRIEQYRAFVSCDMCGLIQELPTEWWQQLVGSVESAASGAPRAHSGPKPAAGVTRTEVYFDQEARIWNRRRGEKVPP